MEKIVQELVRLGMTEYESRVYTALVGIGDGTARQVHDTSGVPRPRVYDILESLEGKGYVEVWESQPRRYRAIEPDRLMRILRESLEESIQKASVGLRDLNIEAKKKTFPIWHIKGDMSINDRVQEMFGMVEKELIILCPRTSTMRSLVNDIKEISDKVSVKCLIPEDIEAFKNIMKDVEFVEPKFGKDALSETYLDIFRGKIATMYEDRLRVELMIIADGLRSILIYESNDERTAIVFELPLITLLQRNALIRLIEGDWR